MKKIVLCLLILVLMSFTQFKSIYDISIKTIDGKTINLETYKGKKILFVIIPLKKSDSAMKQLLEFTIKYSKSISIIGVPSIESGFVKGSEKKLLEMYRKDYQTSFEIMESVRVKKTAKEEQAEIFSWLTDKDKNKHFNREVKGIGHKYFIDEQGVLYADIGPEFPLSHPLMDRIVNRVSIKN